MYCSCQCRNIKIWPTNNPFWATIAPLSWRQVKSCKAIPIKFTTPENHRKAIKHQRTRCSAILKAAPQHGDETGQVWSPGTSLPALCNNNYVCSVMTFNNMFVCFFHHNLFKMCHVHHCVMFCNHALCFLFSFEALAHLKFFYCLSLPCLTTLFFNHTQIKCVKKILFSATFPSRVSWGKKKSAWKTGSPQTDRTLKSQLKLRVGPLQHVCRHISLTLLNIRGHCSVVFVLTEFCVFISNVGKCIKYKWQ